jgi:hypothetical protein
MKKTKLLSGSELIAMLPEDVQQNLIDAMVDLEPIGEAEKINTIKEGKFLNMADMLASSFRWDKSQMGRDYWEGVVNKSFDGKNLSECLEEIIDTKLSKVKEAVTKKIIEAVEGLFSDDSESNIFNDSGAYLGKECLAELSQEEQDKFRDNYLSFKTENEYNHYLEGKFASFSDFISCSFPFFSSKEGFEYWSDIRRRETMAGAKEIVEDVLNELNITTENGKV